MMIEDCSFLFIIIFSECLIVSRAITEPQYHHREAEREQLEVHQNSSDPTITITERMDILECKMELTHFF